MGGGGGGEINLMLNLKIEIPSSKSEWTTDRTQIEIMYLLWCSYSERIPK